MRYLIVIFLNIVFVTGCDFFSFGKPVLPITISGKVYDIDTETPLPKAVIELYGVDYWGGNELITRTLSNGVPGIETEQTGFYKIETYTTAYNNCDTTGIVLVARRKIHYSPGDSIVSHKLPGGSIPLNCNKGSKRIRRTIDLRLERQ